MDETVFPPSPTWFLPNILACREDGSVSYGAKNDVVILKAVSSKNLDTLIIQNAHESRVTSVAFSPLDCAESVQNTVVSCSEDGFVKLWRIDTLTAFLGHKSHWKPKEPNGKVTCLDWSSANPHHIVSAGDNNSLVLWDVLSNTTVKFTFQRLVATAIACCPHNEKLVAVGVKSGLINIINLSGNGDIIFKLRGHDNEIQSLSWCPTPFNVFKLTEINEEYLLASTCQNKEVYIWRAGSDGKCEIKIKTPTSPISKKEGVQYYSKLGNSFSYLSLLWYNAYKLYLSSSFGELLLFDVEMYLNKVSKTNETKENSKTILSCFNIGHHHHSKSLFAIASKPVNGNIIIYGDYEVKSQLKFKVDMKNKIINKPNSEKNESLKWKVDVVKSISLLWTASQDRKLVACKFDESNLNVVFNLSTLNGGVNAIAASPHDPNKVAIGSGDGLIRLWNLMEPSGEAQIYWQKIKDRVMSLAWHPTKDGLLAYGTSEGRVGLIDTNTNKMPTVFKPSHSQAIYALSWGPSLSIGEASDSKKELNLYCVGDNTLSLYSPSKMNADPINLTKLISFQCKKQTHISWKSDFSLMTVGCDDGTIYLVEPYDFKIVKTLLTFKKAIYTIAWHPEATSVNLDLSSYHTYFAAGSTDNENVICVFNCVKEGNDFKVEQVAALKGHYGHILSVSWSTHLDCQLVSTSSDGSVQIWDVAAQAPLINFKPIQKPNLSIWSPVDADVILTGCRNGLLCTWKISKQNNRLPSAIPKTKKQKKARDNHMTVAKDSPEENIAEPQETVLEFSSPAIAVAASKSTESGAKNVKMFSKAWKPDSNTDISRCYAMLKEESSNNEDLNFSLPFLQGDDKFNCLIALEEKTLKTANNWPEYYELCFWSGKLKEVIEEKMKTGHLDDFLVSLAPSVSFKFWQETCMSYSKSLIEKKMFRKAATYLMTCHKIYEAITLLMDQNLYLEAFCIARSRLPKSDSIFQDIISGYAQYLFKQGSFLKACECYIYLKDYLQVAKICGKKSQPEYLSLAALAAKKINLMELEISEATNALLKCFETNNMLLAQQICDDHETLKHLTLINHMFKTILCLENGDLKLNDQSIIQYVTELMDGSQVDFPYGLPHLYQQQKIYKNKEEVLIVVAQELSFAACSNDSDTVSKHYIRALCSCCRLIHNSEKYDDLLLKLCYWLFPDGISGLEKLSSGLKRDSLREFFGAAVVRHLNSDPSTEKVLPQIEDVKKLEDGFLNELSFKHFKNLMEVGLCEKRLLMNQDLVNRRKIPMKNDESTEIQCQCSNDKAVCQAEENGENNMISHEESCLSKDLKSEIISKHENGTSGDFEESKSNMNHEVSDSDNVLNEKIKEDRNLLSRLRSEIDNFQDLKISAPNPIPVFCMLKKILEGVPESEVAQKLLTKLENKWLLLN